MKSFQGVDWSYSTDLPDWALDSWVENPAYLLDN